MELRITPSLIVFNAFFLDKNLHHVDTQRGFLTGTFRSTVQLLPSEFRKQNITKLGEQVEWKPAGSCIGQGFPIHLLAAEV